jgi:hypothetical protein
MTGRSPDAARTGLDRVLDAALQAWKLYCGTARAKISLALIVGGVAIINQGWVQALVGAAWEAAFQRPLHLPDIPPLYGVLLIVLGLAFFLWTAAQEHRAAFAARRTVIDIHHRSMEGLTRPLTASDLPPDFKDADIHPFDIDQSSLYGGGVLSGHSAAIRMQSDIATRVRTFLGSKPNAEIIYHGKAHIPLAFLAGHTLSTDTPVRFYELDRQNGSWWPIDEGTDGEDLRVRVERASDAGTSDVVIRISISYLVHAADVVEALGRPYRDVHLTIADPRVDAVRTRRQIETIAGRFRQILDTLKAEHPGPSRVDVFYSGPMSLAFCLGRQISSTIHPPVFVHNFTANTTPKYAWALHVNGNGSADSLIAYATTAAA